MFNKIRKKVEEPEGTRKILICRNDQDLERCRLQVIKVGGKVIKDLPLVKGILCELPDVTTLNKLESAQVITRIDDDITFYTLCWNWFKRNSKIAEKRPQSISWGVRRIGAIDAWPISRGKQVRVAVIDTGVQLDHPDLVQHLGKGYNAVKPTQNPNDGNGHGTHVAGIIAATDNDFGVVGVAPEVRLFPVKVLDDSGSGTLSDVVSGIQWCMENDIDIINMSLGAAEGNDTFRQAINSAADHGITIIAAAGNSGPGQNTIDYPAKYPETIAVAASDQGDKIANFSSRGPEVDITAPGVDIESTYSTSAYTTLSGTSMAAPHVTGTVALLKGLKRDFSLAEIKSILKRSAYLLPSFSADLQGVGLVQAGQAVNGYAGK